MVHQLEKGLGAKLIDRSKRPFVLTPAGEIYYDGCRKLVQHYFALEEEVMALHQKASGQVRIASIYSIGLSNLDRYVQDFTRANPGAKVRLEYHHPERVCEMIENDEVDLGLISYAKSTRTITAQPWCEDPMVVVCAADHPFAERESVRVAELNGLDYVAFDRDLRIRRELDRVLSSHNVNVNVMLEFDNIETLKRAIEISAGVSLLPMPTVEREVRSGLLAAARLQDLVLTRPLGVIHRRGKELGKTARAFMDFMLDARALQDAVPRSSSTQRESSRSEDASLPSHRALAEIKHESPSATHADA
ncbi:HTH-type transcriptional activator CmpR [Lignipirellula cremea]|uniref:HTH-type transcriptional activator CmpR n=2 Tax=Lignipirellula cremea TaxID=2528010 RepID=A0A518DXS8_9BACT|nr:HTH-type transcriptional activator CmpR [Lignipirellula cremea]